ncbi:MAG TPA: hypothetical protein VF444_00580 [Pseudonocardiaceae bacterium]
MTVAFLRRPVRADLPALVAGLAMLAWSGVVTGPWTLVAALGVAVAAVTPWRWPATAAAALIALATLANGGPGVLTALVTGLLVAAYLVLLDGPPRGLGAVAVASGAGLATLVAAGAVLLLTPHPTLGWLLVAAVAVPLALLLASSGRPRRKGAGDEPAE